ncbi:hypothetical protein RAN3_4348 [plant metagenome]|uniref:Uncharacterized protein n=1 Tax=plant metagenome TaxID=1297885 RepID=A0A484UZ23_9ZZZZ
MLGGGYPLGVGDAHDSLQPCACDSCDSILDLSQGLEQGKNPGRHAAAQQAYHLVVSGACGAP